MSTSTKLAEASTRATERDRAARERLVKAQREQEKAHAELDKVTRERAAEVEQTRTKIWQETFDGYDPTALREAVVDAEAKLRQAFTESSLGSALVEYMTAINREHEWSQLAGTALNSGAVGERKPRPGVIWSGAARVDAAGRPVSDVEEFVGRLIPVMVCQVAEQAVREEVTRVHGRVQAAGGDG